MECKRITNIKRFKKNKDITEKRERDQRCNQTFIYMLIVLQEDLQEKCRK